MLGFLISPKRPEPVAPTPRSSTEPSSEYAELAKSLGFKVNFVTYRQAIRRFLDDRGIARYSTASVERYLDGLTRKSKVPWHWTPLREADLGSAAAARDRRYIHSGLTRFLALAFAALVAAGFWLLAKHGSGYWCLPFFALVLTAGFFTPTQHMVGHTAVRSGVYTKPIPLEHLKTTKLLIDQFPEMKGLSFYVSELAHEPDPFIMCTTHNGWRVVFGMWDEPGYGEPPEKPEEKSS